MIDDALNPLDLNNSAVGPSTHCLKVLSGFHSGILVETPTLAIFDDQFGAVAMLSTFETAPDFFGLAQAFLHQFIASVVGNCVARHSVRVAELLGHVGFSTSDYRLSGARKVYQ